MSRALRIFLGLGALLWALALHAQPFPLRGRVLLFPEPNFRGEPLVVQAGEAIENLEYVRSPRGRKWNDRISSVRLEGPVVFLMFENAGFRGAQSRLTRDVADLGDLPVGDRRGPSWDQRISSLRVEAVRHAEPVFFRWERHEAERAVRSAYRDILGRDPDQRGLRDYRDRLMEQGWTEDQLRDNLKRSPEFRSRDVSEIVRRVYREILGRDPDPSGMASYSRALQNGMSEAEFRADLRRSSERTVLAARESVTRAYREVLRREPDAEGLANYTNLILERSWDENQVREALRQSDEYRRLPRR